MKTIHTISTTETPKAASFCSREIPAGAPRHVSEQLPIDQTNRKIFYRTITSGVIQVSALPPGSNIEAEAAVDIT
jgi:hypothetical protein